MGTECGEDVEGCIFKVGEEGMCGRNIMGEHRGSATVA